jgi:protein-S-isoprenylcysteine O-methyltransferase Ste14
LKNITGGRSSNIANSLATLGIMRKAFRAENLPPYKDGYIVFNSTFKIIYFMELLLISVVRTAHTAKYRKLETTLDRKTLVDIVFLALTGIGMLVPIVYVFSSVLDFANYDLPNWVGWVGVGLFGCAIWLLWRSHADLGRNWTPTLAIRDEHTLVTEGVYRYIRHPMYAAHWLWAIAQVLMLHNWIAGYSFLVFVVPQYLLRVDDEEQMMLEQFKEYRAYMQRTGRIIPRVLKNSSKRG